MFNLKNILFLIAVLFGVICCDSETKPVEINEANWVMAPFIKIDSVNPCLQPSPVGKFLCPIRQDSVQWELKDVFNPAVVVKDDKIHMIYRAEDTVGMHNGTSRLGLATSEDGFHFERKAEPVFYPDHDSMKIFEWEGGCEDPRIVETEGGRYIMTYTAYDGKIARLCLASSDDFIKWKKHGLVLGNGKFRDQWSKSGAIISKQKGNKIIAHLINGKYWMYFGDKNMHAATSEDLIHWKPVLDSSGNLKIVFGPRKGSWDSDLVEPGPPPLLTDQGIVFIYNSRNVQAVGTKDLPEHTYSAGQVLVDKNDPLKVIDRTGKYFFKPEKEYEITGQVGNVCFLEGLAPFKGKWFLYYGTADSKIAVAVYNPKN